MTATYQIEKDSNGDIKVRVLRAITQNYSNSVQDVEPIYEWSVIGVAWKQRHDELYNIYDIVKGGHPIICNVCEDSAVAYLMRLSREYSLKSVSGDSSAYPGMSFHGGV